MAASQSADGGTGIRPHSLGWATARTGEGTLIGFVNVAWDGSDHAFLIDPKTCGSYQRRGIGTRLVRDACGFTPTDAGLIDLRSI
jgi:acetyltransferase (GNAT) family protein